VREGRHALRAAAADLARHAHQIADHGHSGGPRPRSLAVVERVLSVQAFHPDRVVGPAHAGQNRRTRNQRGPHRKDEALGSLPRGAQQPDGVIQALRVLEIDGPDAADALREDVRRGDLFAEGQGGEDGQLRAGVESVDIVDRVRLGIAQPLRLRQHRLERTAVLLHLRQDVIAGAVENAQERHHTVARDSLAQHGVNRNAPGDAGLHRQVRPRGDGALPQLRAAQRHELLVRGNDGLLVGDGRGDDLRGDRGPPDQLRDDIDFWMSHQLAPVIRLDDGSERFGNLLARDRQVAHRSDPQLEAELETDLFGVLGEDGHRAGADVAEADNTHVNPLH